MSTGHLVNNQTLEVVATSEDMALLEEYAKTLPKFADYMILGHSRHHLVAYTLDDLWKLYRNLGGTQDPGKYNRDKLETLIVSGLAGLEPTTEWPPADAERHDIIPNGHYPNGDSPEDRSNDMAAAKKTASKKAPAKKAAAKKDAPKREALVEQNGVKQPKDGTKTREVWNIADQLSAKAKEPASRSDVLEAGEKAGLNPATIATQYQRWRNFHGLGKG